MIRSDARTSEAIVKTFRCSASPDDRDWAKIDVIVTLMLPRRAPAASTPAKLDAAAALGGANTRLRSKGEDLKLALEADAGLVSRGQRSEMQSVSSVPSVPHGPGRCQNASSHHLDRRRDDFAVSQQRPVILRLVQAIRQPGGSSHTAPTTCNVNSRSPTHKTMPGACNISTSLLVFHACLLENVR